MGENARQNMKKRENQQDTKLHASSHENDPKKIDVRGKEEQGTLLKENIQVMESQLWILPVILQICRLF